MMSNMNCAHEPVVPQKNVRKSNVNETATKCHEAETILHIHVNVKYWDWSKYFGGPIVSLNILLRHDKQTSTSINKLKDWILAMDLVNVYESITPIRID